MTESNVFCRPLRFTVVQLIFVTISIIFVDARRRQGIVNLSNSMVRNVAEIPSKVLDASQYTTHAVGIVLSSITPIERVVDKAFEPVSNILGTSSRLLGKNARIPGELMFLYGRSLQNFDDQEKKTVKELIFYVLTNLIRYPDDIAKDEVNNANLPVFSKLIADFKRDGATKDTVYLLTKLVSANGKQDVSEELARKIDSIMKADRKLDKNRLIDELRWIAKNSNNLYALDQKDKSDYKLSKNYRNYEIIQ